MTSLTLIIPVRGRIPLVRNTLHSLELQTHKPDKLIIVDNGNSAADLAALRAECELLSRILPVEIVSCPSPGAPAARNAGLERVQTRWTMFFDSDDCMLPGHIANALDCAERHPDADIIGWDAVYVDTDGARRRQKPFPSSHYLFNAIMHGSLATQCYMARTELFRRVGGWNSDAKIWNDVEISVRILSQKPKIVKAGSAEPNVMILMHPDSITGSNFSAKATERDHTIDIVLDFARVHDFKGRLIPILALKRAVLAGCCSREGDKVAAKALYAKVLDMSVGTFKRAVLTLAYYYTAFSLRGIARILRPVFD